MMKIETLFDYCKLHKLKMAKDIDIISYEKGDSGMILLPEYKVMDRYMLEVYHKSCPSYEVKKYE